jgi:cytochrome P450
LHEPLIGWTKKNHEATLARDRAAMSEIAREFEAFIDSLLDAISPSDVPTNDDVVATLAQQRVWGRPLSNEEISSMLRIWTVGEIGTIAASVGILIKFLAQHSDWQTQWRQDPRQLPQAIEEILRIHGPLVTSRRVTTCPIEMGGRQIAAGERLTLNWVSANRDEAVFADPDSFRLDRDPSKNLLYGAGIHVCPGAPLARLEMRVFLEELLGHSTAIVLDPERDPIHAQYPASGFSTLPVKIWGQSKNSLPTGPETVPPASFYSDPKSS